MAARCQATTPIDSEPRSRNPTFDGVNRLEGVFLHVLFSDDVGDDLNLAVNVYQERAKFYVEPRFCGPDNGCRQVSPSSTPRIETPGP